MRHPKLFAGILVLGVLLTGCSRHPKVDFSVPTESTEPVTTTASETQPMTFKPPEEEKGFDSADAAYQAYLKAVEAQDVEAFCNLFNEEEVRSAKNVPSKFLKNWFNVRQEADYKSYLTRTNPENFQKMVAANFNSYQSAMSAFGEQGEEWELEAGETHIMESDELKSFINTLHIEFEKGSTREAFKFVGQSSGAEVEGEEVILLCVGGKWFPSYTCECVPDVLTLSDVDPEYASEVAKSNSKIKEREILVNEDEDE
ncbi:MAG: hypothetical protein IJ906_00575 [Oscillospiraceae bacterium]|nr:hypothetical protein [Oscillospiraceae bacterium]